MNLTRSMQLPTSPSPHPSSTASTMFAPVPAPDTRRVAANLVRGRVLRHGPDIIVAQAGRAWGGCCSAHFDATSSPVLFTKAIGGVASSTNHQMIREHSRQFLRCRARLRRSRDEVEPCVRV